MKELKVTVEEGVKTLEIRTGNALPLHELHSLTLIGSLRAPGDFLAVRKDQFPIDESHVLVNEDEGRINLISKDREDIGKIEIIGSVTAHPDFLRLGVNDVDVVRTPKELATFIKMNRTMFESKAKAMELVALLMNFKATIDKEIEDSSDNRANFTKKMHQAVESNLPDVFKVTTPLFIGEKAITFIVEIVIDPDDLSCMLLSPDAKDIFIKEKQVMINEQLVRFYSYAIIYQ